MTSLEKKTIAKNSLALFFIQKGYVFSEIQH